MGLLILWIALAVVVVHLCSVLETTLFSVRVSALLDRQSAGNRGAARLLEIKQNRLDDAISAVLILNTLAATAGSVLAGAQAAALFGQAEVGILSAALTVTLLVLSEIIPKTLAARYAGQLSGPVGHALSYLIWLMAPALLLTRALIHVLARRPHERFTRREFALVVSHAPRDGAISLKESMLIGSLIYSREITLKEVMTPEAIIFMMEAEHTVADLLAAPRADAFSRIPLYRDTRQQVVGYVSHREVLKALASGIDRGRKLETFLRPIPVLSQTTPVTVAIEQILRRHEAVAIVAGTRDEPEGLVTVEDLLEAILGMEITDEAEAIANLRPEVAALRRRRAELLRRRRSERRPPTG